MYKLNIIVYVPVIETKYDVLIPIDKKLSTIIHLLKKGIKEMTSFDLYGSVQIYNKVSGEALDINKTIKENGLQNGNSIILI